MKPTWKINQGSPANLLQTEEAAWPSSETFQSNKKRSLVTMAQFPDIPANASLRAKLHKQTYNELNCEIYDL